MARSRLPQASRASTKRYDVTALLQGGPYDSALSTQHREALQNTVDELVVSLNVATKNEREESEVRFYALNDAFVSGKNPFWCAVRVRCGVCSKTQFVYGVGLGRGSYSLMRYGILVLDASAQCHNAQRYARQCMPWQD